MFYFTQASKSGLIHCVFQKYHKIAAISLPRASRIFKMEPQNINIILDQVRAVVQSQPMTSEDMSKPSQIPIIPKSMPPVFPESCSKLPENPVSIQSSVERLTNDILPYFNAASISPRYYGFITGGVTPAAMFGDILTSIYDQNVAVHLPKDTISTSVAVAALNMFLDLIKLNTPEWAIGTAGSGGGSFTTGATASNILGIALGREYVLEKAVQRISGRSMSVGEHGLMEVCRAADIDKIKVLSTLPHSSLIKACSVVGLGRGCVVAIGKGTEGESALDIDLDKLRDLAENAQKERTAYILAVSAGEVNTGRFATGAGSTMQQLREICDKYGIWIHADGAFGIFGRVLMDAKPSDQDYSSIIEGVQGLELADSITSDCHKLLNVPYDCGVFFTRHKQLSEKVFTNGSAAYLTFADGQTPIISAHNIGIENSQRFRALPVYTTLSTYGRHGHIELLQRQIGLARKVSAWLWQHRAFDLLPGEKDVGEAIRKTFMIVLFRAKADDVQSNLIERINASGQIYVLGTQWRGKSAVRLAVSNWQTDIERDFEVIKGVLENAVA